MHARLLSAGSMFLFLGLMFSTGGCVSLDKYNEVVAANNRAHTELAECHRLLNETVAERDELRAKLAAVQPTRDSDAKLIEQLQAEIARLNDRIRELERLLAEAGKSAGPAPIKPAQALPDALTRELEKWAKDHPGFIFDSANGMVKFSTDLLFEKGSDTVTADAKSALQQFAQIINGPGATGFNVYVAGHTDDIPITQAATKERHPTNWYLSVHRSVSVEEVLAAAGLAQDRIGVMGFSMFHPIAPNAAGSKGNPLNRRVEIWIVPPNRFLTTGETAGPAAK